MKPDDKKRDARITEMFRKETKRTIALRSKDREFHGLEREFLYLQEQMLTDFDRSKDIKHPRDLGAVREVILRRFLSESGYLPEKFGVSDRSVRVVSPTGHMSNEIDIALYDRSKAITLMKREDVYAAYPVEGVYGVIQVKSRLTKTELASGLNNLVSFKSLEKTPDDRPYGSFSGRLPSPKGFAVLFAYTADMEWLNIFEQLKEFAAANPRTHLPNAVIVLDQGSFLYAESAGGGREGHYVNEAIEGIQMLDISAAPDRHGLSLFHTYRIILDLLRHTWVSATDPITYFSLPLIANEQSYRFELGPFAETGHCDKHGDYARKIPPEKLRTIVDWCSSAPEINWVEAIDIAYGRPPDPVAYVRQPSKVRIYNPENLPLNEILVRESNLGGMAVGAIAFDMIDTSGMTLFLPYHYTVKEQLITGCPNCSKRKPTAGTKRGKVVKNG